MWSRRRDAAHRSQHSTTASPGNRPKRGGGQQQGSPSLVSGSLNDAEIRLTNAAQSFLRGEHKSMAEARRVHHCERDNNATFKKMLESWRPFTTRPPHPRRPLPLCLCLLQVQPKMPKMTKKKTSPRPPGLAWSGRGYVATKRTPGSTSPRWPRSLPALRRGRRRAPTWARCAADRDHDGAQVGLERERADLGAAAAGGGRGCVRR